MTGPSPAREEHLAGGVANPGAVSRIGATVRRPAGPHTPAVHRFLRHLTDAGLAGHVPAPLGFDDTGREVVAFLPGAVAHPPFPAWAAADSLLVAVARLQRRLHIASRSFAVRAGEVWGDEGYFPARAKGPLVCHNDLCVENVVVAVNGDVAVIDFDYAGPVDPLFDIAVAARHWVPLRDPRDIHDAWRGIDVPARFAALCDVHDLAADDRASVLQMLLAFLDAALVNVRRHAASGHPGFAGLLRQGYEGQNRRAAAWVERFAATLTTPR